MANVYKAVVSAPGGPVPEGTVVAVKVLRQELMHDAASSALQNESKAISLLNTPTSSRSTTSLSAKTYSISSWSAWRA